ncbi:VOC family protein [Lederbergia lenta]|uniref:Glyoxalase family protein n=1 Tax=Lederbergia lenta TaxID=1467 RepID=A0A2X4WKA5_LEDLE|nr:VOC family protein [Lederbergia lenta]MCM3112229.1 VOC family protein [Lederbergia lenta]MEC2323397.1 VOC family protein [Lederbergia lenta]SQI63349.1 glyoxalase family protein [Lederbergia lenta]
MKKANNRQHPVIGTVDLIVENLEHTLAFYINVLGFQVLDQTASSASLTADGKTPLLTLEQPEDVKPRKRTTGLYHIAFLLPDRSDLANIVHYFIQTSAQLQGASDHHVSEALYLSDPEGNGIEIYIDREPNTWKWDGDQVYMTTQALDVEDLLKNASDEGWQGMPTGTIVGHIHLQVAELEKTKEFYCEGLGFDAVLNYGSQALFVSKERYHHHIGLNIWNSGGAPAPAKNSAGLKWFTIIFPNNAIMSEAVNRLRKINAWISESDGEVTIKDPSGIYIRLITEENER